MNLASIASASKKVAAWSGTAQRKLRKVTDLMADSFDTCLFPCYILFMGIAILQNVTVTKQEWQTKIQEIENMSKKKTEHTDQVTEPGQSTEIPQPAESKADKFRRLAVKRTVKAIKALRQVANLFSVNYQSTKEQADKVLGAITAEVEQILNRINGTKASTEGFSL